MLKDINLDSIMIYMENLNQLYDEKILKNSYENLKDIRDISKNATKQFDKLSKFIES